MPLSPSSRSAVANGSRVFVENLDGRSALARRHRDLTAGFVRDLGGDDRLTEAQRQIVRRAAALVLWCEGEERRIVKGDDVDAGWLTRASNALCRLLQELKLAEATQHRKPGSGSITGYLERTV